MSNLSKFADQARSRGVSLGPRGHDFVKAAFALAASNGPDDAAALAARRWGASSRAVAVIKASISAATTNDPLTGPLVSEGSAAAFFAAVAERSILGRLTGLRRVPLYVKTSPPPVQSRTGSARARQSRCRPWRSRVTPCRPARSWRSLSPRRRCWNPATLPLKLCSGPN